MESSNFSYTSRKENLWTFRYAVLARKERKRPSYEEYRQGRPDVRRIVQEEFEDRIGAMTIGVCGPGPLADDVRYAARGVMEQGKVDFWEEAFTW